MSSATTQQDELLLKRAGERFRRLLYDALEAPEEELEERLPEDDLDELEEELAALREPEDEGHRAAITTLAERCGLTPLDEEIVLLAAAVELDSDLRAILGTWPQLPGYRPTVRFAQELWGPTYGEGVVRARFAPTAPLRRCRLLAFAEHKDWDDASSAAESEVQVADRVLRFLLGERGLDPYLQLYAKLKEPSVSFDDLCMPRKAPDSLRTLLQQGSDEGCWWQQYVERGPLLMMTVGGPGSGRTALCEAAAREFGVHIIEVDYQALSTESEDFGDFVTRAFREATLQRAMVVFVNCAPLVPGEDFDNEGFWILSRKLDRFDGPVGLCLDKPLHFHRFPDSRRIFRVDLEVPPGPYRRTLWERYLPKQGIADDVDIVELAKIFNFGGGGIREMIRETINLALLREGPDLTLHMSDFMDAGRELQSRRMGKLTRRMLPKVGLKDLIVPERTRKGIEEIIHTVRYRHIVFQDWGFGEKISSGKGMSALFSGPPGTGKSMTAQVISRECGMNLFRVNLAMVVSKYVGETEERLSKVFEQAKESHSILLFDEADALFAKRSKVKSAQDKYANLEVNFLLQEVEGFEGMVVLTTNLESMIDKAFLRRLNFRLFFPKPDAKARAEIWRRHQPSKAPFADDIDWDALAEDFDITGGYIKNAILRAAQWAAEQDGMITHESLCRAAEAEMAETGRVIREVYR